MSNTTEQTKKRADKKASAQNGQNGSPKRDPIEVAAVPAPEVVATPVSPAVSIESLPEDIQGVLRGFKSQLSAAPPELQQLVASFLFDRGAQPTQTAPAPDASVSASAPITEAVPAVPDATSQAATTTSQEQDVPLLSPIVRRFPKRNVPTGFQRLPPLLMYSAAANQYAPVQALAIDVLQWGSRPVIVVSCQDPMYVLNAAGEIVQVPPKTPFAIPAESDLGNFVRPLAEDPGGAYEIFFSPSSIARDDTGLQIVRYEIGIGARVPKAAVTG